MGVGHRLAPAQMGHAPGAAHDEPNETKQKDQPTNQYERGYRPYYADKKSDPEGADLKLEMGPDPGGGARLVHVSHYQTNQGRYSGD